MAEPWWKKYQPYVSVSPDGRMDLSDYEEPAPALVPGQTDPSISLADNPFKNKTKEQAERQMKQLNNYITKLIERLRQMAQLISFKMDQERPFADLQLLWLARNSLDEPFRLKDFGTKDSLIRWLHEGVGTMEDPDLSLPPFVPADPDVNLSIEQIEAKMSEILKELDENSAKHNYYVMVWNAKRDMALGERPKRIAGHSGQRFLATRKEEEKRLDDIRKRFSFDSLVTELRENLSSYRPLIIELSRIEERYRKLYSRPEKATIESEKRRLELAGKWGRLHSSVVEKKHDIEGLIWVLRYLYPSRFNLDDFDYTPYDEKREPPWTEQQAEQPKEIVIVSSGEEEEEQVPEPEVAVFEEPPQPVVVPGGGVPTEAEFLTWAAFSVTEVSEGELKRRYQRAFPSLQEVVHAWQTRGISLERELGEQFKGDVSTLVPEIYAQFILLYDYPSFLKAIAEAIFAADPDAQVLLRDTLRWLMIRVRPQPLVPPPKTAIGGRSVPHVLTVELASRADQPDFPTVQMGLTSWNLEEPVAFISDMGGEAGELGVILNDRIPTLLLAQNKGSFRKVHPYAMSKKWLTGTGALPSVVSTSAFFASDAASLDVRTLEAATGEGHVIRFLPLLFPTGPVNGLETLTREWSWREMNTTAQFTLASTDLLGGRVDVVTMESQGAPGYRVVFAIHFPDPVVSKKGKAKQKPPHLVGIYIFRRLPPQ